MTRCQPGDLALVVRAELPENLGKMVRIICRENPSALRLDARLAGKVIWRIDRELTWILANGSTKPFPHAPDENLLPIRPEPDEAELEEDRWFTDSIVCKE